MMIMFLNYIEIKMKLKLTLSEVWEKLWVDVKILYDIVRDNKLKFSTNTFHTVRYYLSEDDIELLKKYLPKK